MRQTLISGAVLNSVVALGLNVAGIRRINGVGEHAESINCPVRQQALKAGLINADTDDSMGLNDHYWRSW